MKGSAVHEQGWGKVPCETYDCRKDFTAWDPADFVKQNQAF